MIRQRREAGDNLQIRIGKERICAPYSKGGGKKSKAEAGIKN